MKRPHSAPAVCAFITGSGRTYILDTVPIPSSQWLYVALSVRLAAGANASTATIYAYDTAGTLVTSNTGTFTWSAGSDAGPSSIGGETNASGEGTNAFGLAAISTKCGSISSI